MKARALPLFAASLLSVLALSASAHAMRLLVCSEQDAATGANRSITIATAGDVTQIKGFGSGGIAHYVTEFGPYTASKERHGDVVSYTFEDQFNQKGTVTVVTT